MVFFMHLFPYGSAHHGDPTEQYGMGTIDRLPAIVCGPAHSPPDDGSA
jgi:hypothetical protein